MIKPILSICVLTSLCLPQSTAADPAEHAEYVTPQGGLQQSPAVAMKNWLQQLTPQQRLKAQTVIDEYSPRILELRKRITQKKAELAHLSYNQTTSPDTLPRLGQELQMLRDELQTLLMRADQRMCAEVGIPLGSPQSRGCSMEFSPSASD